MKTLHRFFCASILTAALFPTAAFCAAPPASSPTPQPIRVQTPPRVTIPVFLGRDPDLIADTDDIITQIIPLEYIAAPEMLRTLSAVVKTGTSMVATANAIVVTDSSGLIKRMVQIIALLDVKPANANVIAIIPLTSEAPEAARQINAVFNAQNGP